MLPDSARAGYEQGNFMGPVVLSGVSKDMTCYREEIHGPVLCVMHVPDLEKAIDVINQVGTREYTGTGTAGTKATHSWPAWAAVSLPSDERRGDAVAAWAASSAAPACAVTAPLTRSVLLAPSQNEMAGMASSIFTANPFAARRFRHDVETGMVGINVATPTPPPYFSFTGWRNSFAGDLHVIGGEGIHFYTQQKTVTSRCVFLPDVHSYARVRSGDGRRQGM